MGAPVSSWISTPIDPAATASDPDLRDFDTGTLTVDFTAGGTANDRLAIANVGSGPGEVGVTGSNVTYEGTVIGTFSGGTMASMMNLVREARADREVARVLMNPYGLNPEGERKGADKGDQRGVKFDETAQVWTAPFIMAGINTKVVRRSHALQGYPYGRDFRYHEATMMGKGVPGWLRAAAMSVGLGGFVFLASLGPTRRLLERYLLGSTGWMANPSWSAAERGELPRLIEELHGRGIRFLGYINPFLAVERELYREASREGFHELGRLRLNIDLGRPQQPTIANGRMYLASRDGQVLCLGE